MHILIIRVSAIGDVIHTLPSIFLLKKIIPEAKISWVVQEKAASLLQQQPFIENLYVVQNSFLKRKNWRETLGIIKELRTRRWDAIVDFQGLLKTSFLLSWTRGPKFGFSRKHTRESLSSFFTSHQVKPTYQNIVQKNLALASFAAQHLIKNNCSPTIKSLKKDFCLKVQANKKATVDKWLQEKSLDDFITIAPNTTWQSKHWPLKHWKEFVVKYSKNQNIVLLGKAFGAQAEELAKENGCVHVAPKWDLITTAHLLTKTKLLIAPDTGLLHLADFLNTKTIGLFGPTLASRHGPFLNETNRQSSIQIECAHRYEKTHRSQNCMSSLSADQLICYSDSASEQKNRASSRGVDNF